MFGGALAVILAGAVTATVLRLRAEPSGSFHSYSIFPHDKLDRLSFEAGKVTLQTCCGDAGWGSYRRTRNGQWLWTWTTGSNPAIKSNWIVEPGVLAMTFTDPKTATSFTLRRRVFDRIPF